MSTFYSMKKTVIKITGLSALFIFLMLISEPAYSQAQDEESNYPVWTPAGFLQMHFSANDQEDIPAAFSVHRARMGLKGKVSDKISVNMVVGATEPPNNSPALVNAFADFSLNQYFNIRAGQFFVPFGVEGPEPITINPAIERSYTSRQMNPFRMFRDIGIMGYGNYSFMNYSLAVMNGNGANVAENLNPKDVIGKVDFEIFDDFIAGLSSHIGTYETNNLERRSRQRWGIHGEYDGSPFFARGEMMIREDEISPEVDAQSSGGYLLGGYEINNNWETIGRIEYFDSDFNARDYQGVTLGLNYFPANNTNLSVNGMAFSQGDNNEINFALFVQLQFVL
ncbi:MAG: porin [Bacteroidales bacterium]